ncbi:20558_t:CDS:2 [Cetraspora pellucida]|uniref:20558_t:CDS:1 n=1 Tax=Cetraspora pellucida TaxID=1433469 RepID=A0A9N9F4K9_9GLOM|nr:20558_t:CDS:2 [Cetraspora pellucida]
MSSMKNRPQAGDYIKSAKGVSFSYAIGLNTFQKGTLGDKDSYVTGTLHFNYGKPQQIKSVCLNFKGVEKTTWHKSQARTKAVYSGEHTIVDLLEEVWKTDNPDGGIMNLDIPFKIKLPNNLPDTIETEIGSIDYVLRAVISRKGSLGLSTSTQVAEIKCPLKRTLILNSSDNVPYKLRGESRCGIDYLFSLPPKNNFNPGAYVSIPMRIRFLKPGCSVERIEMTIKTCMDFRCSIPTETRHVKEIATSLLIPRQELRYTNRSSSDQFDNECSHTINLFVPRNIQPTYSGRYISINHQLCIKFCLWGADNDFQVEESIRVTNVFDQQQQSSNGQSSSHSNVSPTFQRTKSPEEDTAEVYADAYITNECEVGTAAYLNPSDRDQVERASNYSSHSSRPSQHSLKIVTDPDPQSLPPSYPKMSNEPVRHKAHYNNSINSEVGRPKVLYHSSSADDLNYSKVPYISATSNIIHNYISNDDQFYSYGFDDEDGSTLSRDDLLLQQKMQLRLAPLPAIPVNMKQDMILSPTPRVQTGKAIRSLNASVGNNNYPPPYDHERGQPIIYVPMTPQQMQMMIDTKQIQSRRQHHPPTTKPPVTNPPLYHDEQNQIIDESTYYA